VLVAAVAAGALVVTSSAASAAGEWESRHWVQSGTSDTGWMGVNWYWSDGGIAGFVCIVDNVANGKGVYVQFNGNFTVDGSYEAWAGTGNIASGNGEQKPWGQQYCTSFSIYPGGAHGYRLNWVNVNMGNYSGGSFVWNNTDQVPNRNFPPDWKQGRVWTSVDVRGDSEWANCLDWPNRQCGVYAGTIPAGKQILIREQRLGEWVGGNPYWLDIAYWNEGDPTMYGGWIPSYYLDYRKNFVDNVFV
jgi:hypothetical protein